MPRTPKVPGGLTERVSTALSKDEAEAFDQRRGPVRRSEYLRTLVIEDIAKEDDQ